MANHLGHKLPWNALADAIHVDDSDPHASNESGPRLFTTRGGQKAMKHFHAIFAQTIDEFAQTDKTPDEERIKFNPDTWNVNRHGNGGYTGYMESLIGGYVTLNLLLLDPHKFLPIIRPDTNHYFCVMRDFYDGGHPNWLAEHCERMFETDEDTAARLEVIKNEKTKDVATNKLDEHLIPDVAQICLDYVAPKSTATSSSSTTTTRPNRTKTHFRSMDPEVTQLIRDHAALLFRCLYTLHGQGLAGVENGLLIDADCVAANQPYSHLTVHDH